MDLNFEMNNFKSFAKPIKYAFEEQIGPLIGGTLVDTEPKFD